MEWYVLDILRFEMSGGDFKGSGVVLKRNRSTGSTGRNEMRTSPSGVAHVRIQIIVPDSRYKGDAIVLPELLTPLKGISAECDRFDITQDQRV
jgi:hypothetical protein